VPSWEQVAHKLGERLKHQAGPCPNHATLMRPAKELADVCPFCADIDAYNTYVIKCRGGENPGMIS
jgi:hypothetical protein